MASSSALHRAHIVRRLLAHLAVVLLITLAAVAGLTAPSSADDEGAGTGTGTDGTAAADTPAGDTAADTPIEAPAPEEAAPAPTKDDAEEAGQPEQTQPEQTKPDQTAPEQDEPKQAEPTTTPKKSAPTARTTTTDTAPSAVETTSAKVWVCKYSRTPSDNEKAQTINSVAYNSNREPGTWGFEDAQGSSYVYGFDTGAASKPTKDDCPTLIAPPTAPTWGEPSCANPLGSYALAAYPSTRATVTTSGSLTPGGTFTVTYTAIPPYRFLVSGATPGQTVAFSHTFTTPQNCPVVINALPTVDTADPCGTANDTVTLSTSPKYTGVDNGDGTATFTAVAPNVFPGNASTYTVHYTENTDVPCVTVIHPAAPVAEPSTACDVPWTISVAATDHVSYAISPASSGTAATTVTITATPDATYAFGQTSGWTVNPDGTATYQHAFAAAVSCLEVPAAPAPSAPTCFDDGSLTVTVPAHTTVTVDGEPITATTVYGPGSYDVVYTAANGYVFSASFVELPSKTYSDITVLPQTGDCVIDVPAQPTSLDACNPAGTTTNVAWDTFPTLANIEWSVDQATGDAVATAINGMAFAGGATEQHYPRPADNGITCTAPADPDITQSTGCDVEGTLTIPATEGVVYTLDGKTIAPGTYDGPLTGTLTATVKTGYENTDAYWKFEVDIPAAPSCLEVPAQPAELDVCNPGNVTNNVAWGTFPTLQDVEWSVDEVTGEAVATAVNGAAFGPGVTEVRFQPSADSGEECTLEPGGIESTCVDAVPYLSYALTLEDGYVGPTDVTITFVNPHGKDYVVTGQPLSGKLLWPGASVDPAGWPGWVRNPDGSYTATSGNYAWTREGVTVAFDVNPHHEQVVTYPAATSTCAGPQQPETGPKTHDGPKTGGPGTHAAPKTHDGVLPNTGAPSGSGLYGVVGGLFVVLGAWLMMRDRRRRA